ncbi:MAG: phosphoenolpyruvate carboxykinase (GTP) [Sedimentisphaerales bacterium]|jgi:phosphoenolpyruvate carboxykinase (GTP)|nr:phosphoenolpyruvate carboxykinase (GTP) [Sedimentisphaerales bacterium]HNY80879.1 phosphoenolpyruvate carboxykinase (GTP) [Sedimentisphaerales bacterium]HOC63282.1 phosphoenolpyruvate carboxykinase (GTP) [Sedimentisphaerales bacterium]HOH66777.1 phosphoenolpyruvate carboxykinase (GTP) [Sedimentisphaerales bacterium]HQN33514.1 phosphoenolpyruvate carboxykinase (GTP) [Sedimentisphaerales bacterium]
MDIQSVLKGKMDKASLQKLNALKNQDVNAFVARAIELCTPDRVWVGTDADEDAAYCRQLAIDNKEEIPLPTAGHTVHFDGYYDQGRNPEVTKYLVPKGETLDPKLKQLERQQGLSEMEQLQRGAYKGRTMLVRFFCLGPVNSVFAIPCLQITDSAYVVHSEDMLYRKGYEEFKRQSACGPFEFFKFRHCTGEVTERMTCKDHEHNRVYIDYVDNTVYSVNTQYAGNTVGLKKLSLRLAIRKADREGWLAEHMFIMRANGPEGRKTYLCGAYPSACGKTSTAMIPGENIVGDDLAYFRVINGEFRTANVEAGIFGIIQDVTAHSDPVIWNVLHNEGEVIFGNVLVHNGRPYWLGMGEDIPDTGMNHVSTTWTRGMIGPDGEETTPSHKNARYTVRLNNLDNRDPDWDNPAGLPVGGIIYGGRESDTDVPVREAYTWEHGICTMGAMLESETTAATTGAQGVRKWNVMSNMDFLSMSVGKYLRNNLEFAKHLKRPKVFGTNYFLKKDGKYLNGMLDKAVWVKWMELRIHGEAEALDAACGLIPKYDDLQRLFQQVLGMDYTERNYVEQFTIRIPELLAKLDRMEKIYATVADTPKVMKDEMAAQRQRLEALRAAKGDHISPFNL